MAFNLKEIISSMRESSSPFDEGTGHFLAINVENVKSILKLSERAQENGSKNVPRASTSSKDAMAEEVDSYLATLISLAQGKLLSYLAAIKELTNHQSDGSPQIITEIYEAAKSELKTTARNHYNRLFAIRQNWIRGEKQLGQFRETNRLLGPARYPEDKTLTYGIIFLILIIELVVNAYALGAAHPEGPLGVAVEIMMFGVANIGVAYLLGNFIWRYFNHVSVSKKLIAGLLAFPMMAFLVFLNFLLAHYRDALSKVAPTDKLADMLLSVQQLGAKATETLLANPIALEDFKSYLLLFVGILASIVATKKSYDLDDPYPGYGKLQREQEKIGKEFNVEQDFSFNDMNDMVEDYSEQVNGQLDILKGNERAIHFRKNDVDQLYDRYESWLASIESAGHALYAYYREENMKARKSSKEPKSFIAHTYSLPKKAEMKRPRQNRVDGSYSAIEKTCKKYLEELNKTSRKYQNQFKDIEKMSPGDLLSETTGIPTIFKD